MLKKEFRNKKVAFVGASNISHGIFLNYLRSSLLGEDIRLFNCGISGNRADMLPSVIEKELFLYEPDFCIITFGVNDMGIWLYDGEKEENEALLRERNIRLDAYKKGLSESVEKLKLCGVVPIVASPFCVCREIEERKDVATVKDNKEKAALITSAFYTRKTFGRLNRGLATFAGVAKSIARDAEIEFLDLFGETYKRTQRRDFENDGIHFNEIGYKVVADVFYEYLTGERRPQREVTDKILKLAETEQKERSVYFFLYNYLYGKSDVLSQSEIIKCACDCIDGDNPEFMKRHARNFLEYGQKLIEIRKQILRENKLK